MIIVGPFQLGIFHDSKMNLLFVTVSIHARSKPRLATYNNPISFRKNCFHSRKITFVNLHLLFLDSFMGIWNYRGPSLDHKQGNFNLEIEVEKHSSGRTQERSPKNTRALMNTTSQIHLPETI